VSPDGGSSSSLRIELGRRGKWGKKNPTLARYLIICSPDRARRPFGVGQAGTAFGALALASCSFAASAAPSIVSVTALCEICPHSLLVLLPAGIRRCFQSTHPIARSGASHAGVGFTGDGVSTRCVAQKGKPAVGLRFGVDGDGEVSGTPAKHCQTSRRRNSVAGSKHSLPEGCTTPAMTIR
jgi:hypothetical protein